MSDDYAKVNATIQHTGQMIAEALNNNFTSPNVSDSNGEAANLVDTMQYLAKALWRLGLGSNRRDKDDFGAIEILAMVLEESADKISNGLYAIAKAIEEHE
jgi:hypothetical protein